MNQAAANPTLHRCPLCGQAASLDGVKIVADRRLLVVDGATIEFTPKEFAVVERLHKTFGRAVDKDSLIMAMYPDADSEPEWESLAIVIMKVRRKIAGTRVRIVSIFKSGVLMELGKGK